MGTKQTLHPLISQVLDKMHLEEKIGQLYQAPFFTNIVTGHHVKSEQTLNRIREGHVGSILSVHDKKTLKELQKTAVEESRLGIPLLFCFDVIHGYKTAFPINIAQSCSWDPLLIKRIASAVASETRQEGIHLTFSPMVDIVRDPRWGRVMESNGEDPYLSSQLAKAYVEGYQGTTLNSDHQVASCVKHFAGYGAVEAGREYNTVDISERVLRNIYFPPFQSAINANTPMIMTAFNTLFDKPCTANQWLLKDILRNEMGFRGTVISDYTSSEEIIDHKIAKDTKDAALQCFDSGLDHEMVSTTYIDHLADLVREGKIKEEDIDSRVANLLTLKMNLGLFEDPYRGLKENKESRLSQKSLQLLAQEAVEKTTVLLKNNGILPLSKNEKIVLCGPYSASDDLIGEWAAITKKTDVTTLKEAFFQDKNVTYIDGLSTLNHDEKKCIKSADAVIFAIGEQGNEAGEGNSKTNLDIEHRQRQLLENIYQINPNIVLIVFAGRPLILTDISKKSSAILYAWQPGIEAGTGLRNLILGKTAPSAKLTMTFPRHQGQIPIYYNHYNTGRPFDIKRPDYRYNSRYRDCLNDPLYVFGHGLTYTKFSYGQPIINHTHLTGDGSITLSVEIKNTGTYEATEIIQLYIEAKTYSVARPVNELKSFSKITLKPKAKQTVAFHLTVEHFRSYNAKMRFTAEQRHYRVKVGGSSADLQSIDVYVDDCENI